MVGSKHLHAVSTSLTEKQKQVEDSTRIAGRLKQAQAECNKAQMEISFLETSVSTFAYVPTLLGQLEELGKQHSLKVTSVRPRPAPIEAPRPAPKAEDGGTSGKTAAAEKSEPVKPYDELLIDLELEGTYWNIHDFMFSLTRFPKIVAVNQIEMAPMAAAEKKGSPTLLVKLGLTAFVFKESTPDKKPVHQAFGGQAAPAPTSRAALADGRSNNNEG